jgi:hypothetical protein
MMGGHQVNWLIDGVPIPNTNIATNLGPQILPRDIDYLEVYSGSYDADYGDRTYGIFNVLPRTGFERERECDLVLTAGNFYQTDNQLSCGDHTQRSAYYVSVNGNRSDYGLQTPVPQVVNDAENGFGGFTTFMYNPSATNQFRLAASLRRDYYQIPMDPNPNSVGNGVYSSSGLHDAEVEPDGYITISWVHEFNPYALLQRRGLQWRPQRLSGHFHRAAECELCRRPGSLGVELQEQRSAGRLVQLLPAPIQLLRERIQGRYV